MARPVDVVFAFAADEGNEPKYNPCMLRSEKVSERPIGVGTRFHATIRSMGRPLDMVIEFTACDRPTRLASVTRLASADIGGRLTFEPVAGGTRMRWSWDLRPRGVLRALTPVMAWIGWHQERAIWTRLKECLEAGEQPGKETTPRG